MVRKIKVSRILGKQQRRASALRPLDYPTNKYSVSAEYNNNTTPSVVSTNSDSSGTGNEVTIDWATATSVAAQMVLEAEEQPLKKKRTRSFKDRLFRARRSFKTDNKRDFSLVESPIDSPTPTQIAMASGDDTTSTSPEEATTLNVRTLSLTKLAPPKPDGLYSLLDDDESSAFYKKQDRYLTAADKPKADEDENAEAPSETKDPFSIPLSYFLKKKSSWGISTKSESSQSKQDSQKLVLQESHWGKKLRRRSRDGSTSWYPTEEERYKISQGFVTEKDQQDGDTEDDDSSSGPLSSGSESTATGLSTFVTKNTGTTEDSEETNDTTSAFTGHYTGDSRYDSTSGSESISTNKSAVTGTTGDTSMFSLGVDDDYDDYESETSSFYPRRGRSRSRSPVKRKKRRLIESDKNILAEVFSDLRLLVETMADEETGLRPTCFVCA